MKVVDESPHDAPEQHRGEDAPGEPHRGTAVEADGAALRNIVAGLAHLVPERRAERLRVSLRDALDILGSRGCLRELLRERPRAVDVELVHRAKHCRLRLEDVLKRIACQSADLNGPVDGVLRRSHGGTCVRPIELARAGAHHGNQEAIGANSASIR